VRPGSEPGADNCQHRPTASSRCAGAAAALRQGAGAAAALCTVLPCLPTVPAKRGTASTGAAQPGQHWRSPARAAPAQPSPGCTDAAQPGQQPTVAVQLVCAGALGALAGCAARLGRRLLVGQARHHHVAPEPAQARAALSGQLPQHAPAPGPGYSRAEVPQLPAPGRRAAGALPGARPGTLAGRCCSQASNRRLAAGQLVRCSQASNRHRCNALGVGHGVAVLGALLLRPARRQLLRLVLLGLRRHGGCGRHRLGLLDGLADARLLLLLLLHGGRRLGGGSAAAGGCCGLLLRRQVVADDACTQVVGSWVGGRVPEASRAGRVRGDPGIGRSAAAVGAGRAPSLPVPVVSSPLLLKGCRGKCSTCCTARSAIMRQSWCAELLLLLLSAASVCCTAVRLCSSRSE
jgi:hypothetical protein